MKTSTFVSVRDTNDWERSPSFDYFICLERLEEELSLELNNALSLLLGGRPVVGNNLRELAGHRILLVLQAEVSSIERVKWVVEEVVALHAELQLFGLGDLEVLENRQVPVEVR